MTYGIQLRSVEDGITWITVSTAVRYNNFCGVMYFIPVRYGHKILFGVAMRKMAYLLKDLG